MGIPAVASSIDTKKLITSKSLVMPIITCLKLPFSPGRQLSNGTTAMFGQYLSNVTSTGLNCISSLTNKDIELNFFYWKILTCRLTNF